MVKELEERDKLKKYGGGCHQKIGVSIENHPLGKVITEKGLTPKNKIIDKRAFSPTNAELLKFEKPVKDFYPKSKKDFKLFSRSKIEDGIKELESIKNSGLYISRASSIESGISIDSSNLVWTSGTEKIGYHYLVAADDSFERWFATYVYVPAGVWSGGINSRYKLTKNALYKLNPIILHGDLKKDRKGIVIMHKDKLN